jgi:hypothetical protein
MAADMTASDSWHLLAHGVARALGYSANAEAGMELGRRLTKFGALYPLRNVDENQRRALAVGMAGLLPSQRAGTIGHDQPEALDLESRWHRFAVTPAAMPSGSWKLSGCYPNNSPVRRVVALSGLWPLIEVLSAEAPRIIRQYSGHASRCAGMLEEYCRLTGDAYWRRHYDFGFRTREADLVGTAKGREIVLNAVLPYVAGVALMAGDGEGLTAVLGLLSLYPSAPPHAVTRHMRRQLGMVGRCGGAGMQQGLLHLFRGYCRRGLCARCPLNTRDGEPAPPVLLGSD